MEATVSAGLASGLIDFASAGGANRDALIKGAGLSPHKLKNPDNRIPFHQYTDLMRLAQAATGDPALALHFGEQVGMSEVSVLGLIMEASATMGEAFLQLQRYGRLATEFVDSDPGPRVMLMPRDGKLYMVFNRSQPNDFPEMTEESFARLVCGPRRFLPQPHVMAIHVTHPAPVYRSEYDRVFQCPVHFSSDWNAMELHPEITGWKVAQNPRYVFGLLTKHADSLLAELDATRTLKGRLEALLLADLHKGDLGGDVSADAMASRLGFSRQTLFRKLKEEGTSFAAVLDGLRRRLAEDYLRGGKASIYETAYLVGFSEPAAFARAFKRWTGRTPGQFCKASQA
ncbi:bacterial regulatory helix-turn-helix protein, AraC family protein [Asticcacaulis biprosthecium C19]|uniref:Bacterial regulatory helix-turn-helix protein, AraC family protein n=1 Tax=Asticcacaulis biprosthecium C19 TaxID=715226 RepID=F4QRR3_9CAUL|nr:AraC family transcriptional regulator [Asticcacaulis biprosthecium]EGF89433.1 bacterial regulatory helix-turn-helix protein, AraC family protein [Asticcacaulis biprosthecium C19]